jgi:hypothetical protein
MSWSWEGLDRFERRNPRWTIALLVALAIVATLLLLTKSEGAVVMYQAF